MVAIITYPTNLKNALNYHEKKVHKGKAECLYAENFLLDKHQLKFYDKLHRFENQIALNPRIKTNLLHISLNFDPSEKIPKEDLVQIGNTYMEKIGFANQPYLVYQHDDAGHPHIHILTTTIQNDGSPIYLHNIGKEKSEPARTEIESDFNLIKAAGRGKHNPNEIPPIDIEKALYGTSETKRAITNVLDAVINKYKYTSLPELNAILKLGNVVAERGKEGGRIHRTNGLLYRLLDDQGNKVGKSIKASSIYSKPILAELEIKFEKNKSKRQQSRQQVRDKIQQTVARSSSMQDFIKSLKGGEIDTILRINDIGFIYGITFIDHKSKCVFNGSDLDKKLTAAAIQQQFASSTQEIHKTPIETLAPKNLPPRNKPKRRSETSSKPTEFRFDIVRERNKSSDEMIEQYSLLKQLLQSENIFNPTPFGLTGKKKKKKKKKNKSS